MSKNLFRYIWRHSRRDQLAIFFIVIASLPFYYVSLDLPRKIVNEAIQGRAFEGGRTTARFLNFSLEWPAFLGGGQIRLTEGFEVERLELLFGLSLLFLLFVLVNGWFKYVINVAKGALGERMMRRMRFELFAMALRFTPETMRTVKSSEAATIIKDEVEPIGGFIGDAFIQPVFLGTQAATALLFILLQSVWLGLMAAAVVGVQFIIIPRMRRELLRLGRRRQIASRKLAGRVSEVIDGMEAVHVHNTGAWERAEIGHRLYELFDIRFRIYKRKFVVKFLNNLLAQMTPFFFYAFGGYFALRGRLDIGQLVAVIAAYRELPPPLKELIDWDQQRLDVQVKYDQVVAYFAPDRLMPQEELVEEVSEEPLSGLLETAGLTMMDGHGAPILDHVALGLELPSRVALVSGGSQAASAFARALARRADYGGELKIGGRDLAQLSRGTIGARIAYAGVEPVLFPGTLRDNMLYGLRQRQLDEPPADDDEAHRLSEAEKTGNPSDSIAATWIDLPRSGADDAAALDRRLIDLLKRIGLGEDIYRFGLAGRVDPERDPELAERLVEARERMHAHLVEGDMAQAVEFFDPERYNSQATVAENLLFGVPTNPALIGRALGEHPGFRQALERAGLTDDVIAMGARIAETMTEIFRGLPPGHPLFEQFSFVHADELVEVEAIVQRLGVRGRGRGGPTREDRMHLLALPLAYVEPRHRLGLLDDAMQARLLEGRKAVHEMLARESDPGVAFYERDKVNTAAPVRDNLLFGRVNETIADARERVRVAGAEVIDELSLRVAIERVGLDHQVGPAGRLLTAQQRASVSLIRCLVKRPDLMVVDGALAPFGESRTADVIRLMVDDVEDRTLAVVLANEQCVDLFDAVIRFEGASAALSQSRRPTPVAAEAAE